jgi:hypothetical protein
MTDVRSWIRASRRAQGLPASPTAEESARIVAVVAPGDSSRARKRRKGATE